MPTQVQFRRGTTAQNNNFTGAAGEISVDVDRMVLRVHDGVTAGGTAMVNINGTVTNAVNIVGGQGGSLPYQSATGVTQFINIGTSGYVLSSDGSTATWVSLASLTGVGGINADELMISTATSGNKYLVVTNTNGDYQSLESDVLPGSPFYNIGTGFHINNTLTVAGNILPFAAGVDIGSLENPFGSVYVSSGTVYIGGLAIEDINGSLTVNNTTIVTTATIGTLVVTTATNLFGGTAGQLVYQSNNGATGFVGPGSASDILTSDGTNAPTYVSTSNIVVGFADTAGKILSANTTTQQVGFADYAGEIIGGQNGQLLYQSSPNITEFVSTGTVGDILISGGISSPTYSNTSSVYVGVADRAGQLLGGAEGSILYQTNPNFSTFLAIGGNNSVLTSNGNVPQWSNSLSLPGNLTIGGNLTISGTATYVNSTITNVVDPIFTIGGAINGGQPAGDDNKDRGIAFQWYSSGVPKVGFFGYDDSAANFTFIPDATIINEVVSGTPGAMNVELAGGTTGQLVYQSGASQTGFVGPGTAGQLLMSGGAAIPVYTNTASIYVEAATRAETLFGGATGQFVYQSSAGVTAFISTGSIYTGFANKANNVIGGAAGSLVYQTGANATGMLALGSTGFILVAGASAPEWTSLGTISASTATNISGGTSGQLVYQSAPGTTAFTGPGTAGQLLMSNGTNAPAYQSTLTVVGGTVNVNSVTASSTTQTGALVVAGGLGVGGNLNVGGTVTVGIGSAAVSSSNGDLTLAATGGNVTTTNIVIISNTTGATSAATGALQVAGGVGVAGGLFVGGTVTATTFVGSINPTNTATLYVGFANRSNDVIGGSAGQIVYQTASNTTGFANSGTTGQFLQATTNGAPVFTSTASIYVNSSVFAEDIIGGTAGQIPYQSAPGVTAFTGPGTAGQLLMSNGTNAPAYQSTLTVVGGTVNITSITASSSTSTGALQVAGGVGIGGGLFVGGTVTATTFVGAFAGAITGVATTATNIQNGTAGQIPYQSAPGVTAFTGPGTAGQLLMSNSTSAPAYQSTLTVTGGTVNITSVTASTTTATGALVVAGGVGIGGDLRVAGEIFAQRLTIEYTTVTTTLVQTDDIIQTSNTTNATTTASGALQIAGGVGIGRDVYIGGNVDVVGTITHKGLVLTSGTAVDQIYTSTKSLTLTDAWQDTGIAGTDLATGSYMVQVAANDSSVGGGQVNMYYTGVMSWYSLATGENAYSEIVLHRAGNAAAAGTVFLRVAEVSSGTLKLQIAGTTINSGASNYAFSFRRMI